MRDSNFYREIFGNTYAFQQLNPKQDIVRIIDVDRILKYEQVILLKGGQLTVPTIELDGNKKIAYYSDPQGYIFALFQNDK